MKALRAALLGVATVSGAGHAKTPAKYPDPLYLACTPRNSPGVKAILVAKERSRWDVVYFMSDGRRVPRSAEYSMQPLEPADLITAWEGRNLKNPNVTMEGFVG